jgi:hypothetical protein
LIEKTKIQVVLPDGVGLKNFVFTDFIKVVQSNNLSLSYWNATPFDFANSDYDVSQLNLAGRPSAKSDLYKRARKIIEIKNFIKQSKNTSYNFYLFSPKNRTFKQKIKNLIEYYFFLKHRNSLGKLRLNLISSEKNTQYYSNCLEQLNNSQPKLLLVTNQRPLSAVAPVEAAKELGIPTVSFIFSWDNLPKATMVIETDFYFVWSEYMKEQLLYYYPYILENQILITGTPQFEIHFNESILATRQTFTNANNLNKETEYICFSGDDVTTSPHDQIYLEDLAKVIKQINEQGLYEKRLGIIFRPCPVDFSNRFNHVLSEFPNEITLIRPLWKCHKDNWNSIIPSYQDQVLLANTVHYTKMVVNVGSSMVFDYVAQNKPCAFINYNPQGIELKKDIYKIYKYIHFNSMPSKDAVIWLNSKEELRGKILEGLNNPDKYIYNAKKWFKIINQHPPQKATERIVEEIKAILLKHESVI